MAPAAAQWTETEISLLIQAWSEVDATFPSARCKRGTGTFRKKLHATFLRRTTLPRTFSGINHMQYALRDYVLFVHQFDSERRKDGGRYWFELNAEEREQRRALVPYKSRGLISALGRETFGRLMQMERANKWVSGESDENEQDQDHGPNFRTNSTLSQHSQPETVSSSVEELNRVTPEERGNSPPLVSEIPSTKLDGEDVLMSQARVVPDRNGLAQGPRRNFTSTQAPKSSATVSGKATKPKAAKKRRKQFKHRDCNILLESMMELQNKQMREAFRKLRADIEGEVRRSTDMLNSIITDQFDDPGSSGDVAFVTKVLKTQGQQVKDRFDRFEENRTSEEAANRALVGQRF